MQQRSIRGATTIQVDTKDNVIAATKELLKSVLASNDVASQDIINIIFTATADIKSAFPALAARELGLTDVPLIDCQQMMCDGALELCIRVMLTYNTQKSQRDIKHVYLHGARVLRPDLVKE